MYVLPLISEAKIYTHTKLQEKKEKNSASVAVVTLHLTNEILNKSAYVIQGSIAIISRS
jgi:hypothetical protein